MTPQKSPPLVRSRFVNDATLNKWARKTRLSFASAISCEDKAARSFVESAKKDGLVVVTLENWVNGKPGYISFHRSPKHKNT